LVFLAVKLQHGSKLGEKEVVAKVVVCNPVVSLKQRHKYEANLTTKLVFL